MLRPKWWPSSAPAAETPFDLIESVRILDRAALSRSGGRWRLDPRRAVSALAGAAARSVVRRVADLDAGALTLARMLAVYGDDAELADLASAARQDGSAARAAAEMLVAAGLVRLAGAKVRYAHDRLRAEVLLDIPPRVRAGMAAALAEALREAGAQPGEGERGMAMLWRRLEGGLDGGDPAFWRDAFAAGAHAARQVGDRAAAETFVRAGLELCGRSGGFTYALLSEATSAAISRGDHAEACRLADTMGAHATTPAERACADEMRVFARRVSGDLDAALEVAREVLAHVKIKLPRRPTPANLARALAWVFRLDPRHAHTPLSPEELAVEAPMMRAMNGIGSPALRARPPARRRAGHPLAAGPRGVWDSRRGGDAGAALLFLRRLSPRRRLGRGGRPPAGARATAPRRRQAVFRQLRPCVRQAPARDPQPRRGGGGARLCRRRPGRGGLWQPRPRPRRPVQRRRPGRHRPPG
ncbi:hypothetical protein [Phenylobacterium sp. J367]|uniref:hypothetical protein n=1 Tax=Phenylobacterium sp. J367 TaxID=2898435 RepID=UPI002151CD31|nr:hypothetical protein [Phenylobacterium sp. J367]MCR5879704.1 hypothetical protein [Phenylobacterium sp. J367]